MVPNFPVVMLWSFCNFGLCFPCTHGTLLVLFRSDSSRIESPTIHVYTSLHSDYLLQRKSLSLWVMILSSKFEIIKLQCICNLCTLVWIVFHRYKEPQWSQGPKIIPEEPKLRTHCVLRWSVSLTGKNEGRWTIERKRGKMRTRWIRNSDFFQLLQLTALLLCLQLKGVLCLIH